MRKGLKRVLRVRQLLEERATADLQIKAAELRRLEEGAEQNRRLAAAVQIEVLGQGPDNSAANGWIAMADAEIFSWKSRRLEAAAWKTRAEVAAVRDQAQTCRVERQQAEALLEEVDRAELCEQRRREQTRIDDWFQSAPARMTRGSE